MSSPMSASHRTVMLSTAAATLVVIVCLAFLLPVPYSTLRPGPVFNTLGEFNGKPMFSFGDDVRTYPTTGTLDFTTVSVSRAESTVSLVDGLRAWLDPDTAIVPHDFVYPDNESNEESTEQGQQQLISSKDASEAAALRAAGLTVPEVPEIADVFDDGAAHGKLEVGDIVLAVDGTEVTSSTDVGAQISKRSPGDDVSVKVKRGGTEETVTMTTTADKKDADKARIGVSVATSFDFPIEITNNVGDSVGGPSAGTMFALAIYDSLTPGALTGGQNVAGTGTIDGDGNVGSIGGVRQKMAGAAAAGADIFLVPAANCDEASAGDDHGLTLVKIDTLDSAISSLEKLAADPKTKVPSCS